MRVLLLGDYPDDARLGSSKVYHKLRGELEALGARVHLLLAPDLPAYPRHPKLRWAATPWLAERAVAAAFRRHGPFDVIDAASAEGLGVGARRALGQAYGSVGLVARSHGLEHRNYARMLEDARVGLVPKPWTRRWWYPLARMSQVAAAARLADRLLVLNPGDAAFAAERGWKPAARIHVVGHGVSEALLAAAPEADAPRGGGILFCGSWDPVKGTPYLVEAFARLVERRPQARLTVLGPGPSAETVLAAFPERARGAVTVLPRAEEAEVMRQLRRHDVLAHPSTFEGFGMAVLEAMSQRLPVVATAQGCAPAVVREGETGWLVAVRDAEGLSRALEAALADPAEARRRGDHAHALVRHRTWRRAAEETMRVYELAVRDAHGMVSPE